MGEKVSLFETIKLLSQLTVFDSYDFEDFLKKLIKLLARVVPTDSCLIYFYDRDRKKLILIGSNKAKRKLIDAGKITMGQGEGITGWVADHKKTVILKKQAYKDKRFKLFKELPEDKYEAFLSVPIIDREGVVGVINLQNKKPFWFTTDQIKTMEAMVQIIASAFEKVILQRKVGYLQNKLDERKAIEKAKGLLMKFKKIAENDAYKLLRDEAMKKRKTMKEIADAVILVWG